MSGEGPSPSAWSSSSGRAGPTLTSSCARTRSGLTPPTASPTASRRTSWTSAPRWSGPLRKTHRERYRLDGGLAAGFGAGRSSPGRVSSRRTERAVRGAQRVAATCPTTTGSCVASSMPVRDLDTYAAAGGAPVPVAANRGASGIDGTVATAAGFARGLGRPVTLLIGDLALLHDLNSLAMLRDVPVVVVVLNNDGGGIFSFLPVARHKDSSSLTSVRRRAWTSDPLQRCSASITSVPSPRRVRRVLSQGLCPRFIDPDRSPHRPRGERGLASQDPPRGSGAGRRGVTGPIAQCACRIT